MMKKIKLENWFLNYRAHKGLAAKVPCSLYSVLLENGLMKDPFFGDNEAEAYKMSEYPCEFYTQFDAGKEITDKKKIFLRFNGLDTVCRVFLNGVEIGFADNMHRTYEISVKDVLKENENTLRVIFESPTKYAEKMHKKRKVWSVESVDDGASQMRKALFMFGWDWGPKLPDMGIFRDAELIAYDDLYLRDINIEQRHFENKTEISVSLEGDGEFKDSELSIICGDYKKECVFGGRNITAEIENPKLWWPNGYGEQPLYDITVKTQGGEVTKKIGLRTLTVSTEKDKYGEEFCFVVNKTKIFSMGANYVPCDSLLPRITPERMKSVLLDCKNANFNTVRVWGGGYYQNDEFYNICDELGLIVWQDFMFACINVYLRDSFEKSIIAEATENIKRLRHHACIGLFCGNNEMEFGILNWGIDDSLQVKNDYIRLYEHILPDLCEKYAPYIFYWPSSPSSGGGFDKPDDENRGDTHYWDVWFGSVPYEDYKKHCFRFCSEFGFESYPNMKTLGAVTAEENPNPFSRALDNHQKCNKGNALILTYCSQRYLYPMSLEMLVYASQLVQAEAIKYGVEHFRRNRGRCMGALYWQLNDCWPVASWSSVDYYGRWKALHYFAKNFYAPVLLSADTEDKSVMFNISNETRGEFRGRLVYSINDNGNNKIFEKSRDVEVLPLCAKNIVQIDFSEWISGYETCRYLEMNLYDENGIRVSGQTVLFTKPKYFDFLKPKISVDIKNRGDIAEIEILSDVFLKNAEVDFEGIDITPNDNFTDITGKITLCCKTPVSCGELLKRIRIKSVYDIGNGGHVCVDNGIVK